MKCEICEDFYGLMRRHIEYLMFGRVVCVDMLDGILVISLYRISMGNIMWLL